MQEQLPVTIAQKQIWLYQQAVPLSSAYHIHGVISISADTRVSLERLQEVCNSIFLKYDILRCSFKFLGDAVVQVEQAQSELDLDCADIASSADLESHVSTFVTKPFDISNGPLFRVSRVQNRNTNETWLIWVAHHMVCDGVSLGIVARDFLSLLKSNEAFPTSTSALCGERAVDVKAIAFASDKSREYWRNLLADLPPRLTLPRARLADITSTTCAGYGFQISGALLAKLRQACLEQGATTVVALLGSFLALLAKISRQRDMVIGLLATGRKNPATFKQVGFFANTLPIRVQIDPSWSFAELLTHVSTILSKSLEYQDYPFANILEDIGAHSHAGEFPITPVLFNMLPNAPSMEVFMPQRLGHFKVHTDAKTDWEWYLCRRADRIDIEIHYKSGLFAPDVIEGIADAYLTLLEHSLRDLQKPVLSQPLLNDTAYRQIVHDWNATAHPYRQDALVHQLFEEQTEKTPDAVAIQYGDQRLSYAQLNAQANQLAHHLRSLGVRPGDILAIFLRRSIDFVTALLAILKAGGAYLPIDTELPVFRLKAVLADAKPKLVLTHTSLRENIPIESTQFICLDSQEAWGGLDTRNPSKTASSNDLAYIIYTSGTTGEPKGVLKEHTGLVNYLSFIRRKCEFTTQEIVLAITNVGFDPATRDILGPLSFGGKIIIMPHDEARNPQAIFETIIRERVTALLSITPSLLRAVCASSAKSVNSLRWILTSGEALFDQDYELLQQSFGTSVQLLNQYGPTEITMIGTCYLAKPYAPVTIGRPVDNVRAYLLDEYSQPAPIGVSGEIYLAGVGITLGYLGRVDETAEKFLADAFFPTRGRMYRTGDLARRHTDGSIEFLGRLDDQVKVNGVRIELGEIDAALKRCNGVRDAATVLYQTEGSQHKLLLAYVVMKKGSIFSEQDLRDEILEYFPKLALPSIILTTDDMPITKNGKKNLPEIIKIVEKHRSAKQRMPLITPTEKTVAKIWSDVLGTDVAYRDDDFFDLGGNSLQEFRVRSLIKQRFGLEISIYTIQHAATVEKFASLVNTENLKNSYAIIKVIDF
jgi:pristinamycin I synthase 3 and 4